MQRRVVICGLFKYPRGNATSNYVQYLADALKEAGYRVSILSYINTEFTAEKSMVYRDVDVHEINSKSGIRILDRALNNKLFEAQVYFKIKSFKLGKNDLIINLARWPKAVRPSLRLRKKYGVKVAGCPLEWFEKSQFDTEKLAEDYERCLDYYGEMDLLFPISHKIAERYKGSKAKITVLPIMADVAEYSSVKKENKPYEFIFPANGLMKDALGNMLEGLACLSEQQLASIRFHVTGVKAEDIQKLLADKWNKVKDCLIIHSWMQYDELIELYRSVHYLFLAREINQMTLSNFPSKVPEVMTHGIVPIVSRVGDYTKYYLEDDINSLIFDGCDSDVCKKALERAINIPFEHYMELSTHARECVETKFDYHNWIKIIGESVEAIY